MDSQNNWYCIHTKPAKEKWVNLQLQSKLGVETYFPQLRRRKSIRGSRQLITEPLFPRYLFCKFNPVNLYRAVRYSNDVLDIVRIGNTPTPVNESTIRSLKEWAGNENSYIEVEPDLKAGDTVQIVDGSMRGLQAIFQKELGKDDRVTILLSIMETQARVTLDRALIQPAANV